MADKLISVLENGTFKRFVDMGDGTYAEKIVVVGHSAIDVPTRYSFTRPADTTTYDIGDLIANSTTAGSVVAMSWTGATLSGSGGSGEIAEVVITRAVSIAISLRVHFFTSAPTVAGGDNAAINVSNFTTGMYVGFVDVDLAGTVAGGGSTGVTTNQRLLYELASGDTLYGLIEARSSFAPTSASAFNVLVKLVRAS